MQWVLTRPFFFSEASNGGPRPAAKGHCGAAGPLVLIPKLGLHGVPRCALASRRTGATRTGTGSFALGYYGKPRMTRALDFVVALMEEHVDGLVKAFSSDFYIDEDAARSAVRSRRIFNLMHLTSVRDWAPKLGVAELLDEIVK